MVELHPPDVRGNDHEIIEIQPAEVVRQQEERRHVVDRVVEEALNLAGMQIDREDAACLDQLEHAGDDPGADRLAGR